MILFIIYLKCVPFSLLCYVHLLAKAKNNFFKTKKKNPFFKKAAVYFWQKKNTNLVIGCGYGANIVNYSPLGNLQGSLSALKVRKEERAH